MIRTITLGNLEPKKYLNNPRPPRDAADLSLSFIESWATDVCGLNIGHIEAVGKEVLRDDDSVAYVMDEPTRKALIMQLVEEPKRDPDWQKNPDVEYVTTINVSPDSSLLEAVHEIKRIWGIHSSSDMPDWIGYSPEAKMLAAVLGDEFGTTDLREVAL